MAYVFKLPQTVTEEIMRYAIGYPRDRLCSIATGVRRSEMHHLFDGRIRYSVVWYYRMLHDGFLMFWYDNQHLFLVDLMEPDKKRRLRLLQEQCEPCEPTELELQRMYF